jgi:hypothetical protein
MGQYIITIVPVIDEDEIAGPASQTIVRIDTEGGHPSVKELTIRAPDGAGLSSAELPKVDFAMLLQAFMPRPGAGATDAPAVRPAATVPTVAGQPVRRPVDGPAGARSAGPRRAKARNDAKGSHLRTGRAYRKAPSAQELEAAYEMTGTITGVAAHFDVPVHTAQGWISRLRRQNNELTGS